MPASDDARRGRREVYVRDEPCSREKQELGSLGYVQLFFLAFFWVCGGPYGNEGMIQLGPSGVVFLVYLLITMVYSLPISLINAEVRPSRSPPCSLGSTNGLKI